MGIATGAPMAQWLLAAQHNVAAAFQKWSDENEMQFLKNINCYAPPPPTFRENGKAAPLVVAV